jgi:N-acetylglucosaminyl-diphospho-decaprenol L-rhamnosyltransferase
VVLCWNNAELIDRCVDELLATRWDGDLEVVVVDNGSTDGSVDDWASRHPDVRLVQTGANLGFAGGVNRGLTDLDGVDAVALVNSDAFVDPGWLAPLVRALDADDRRGAACPKILFADRREDGRAVINNVGNELGPTWELHDRGYGEVDDGQYDEEEDVWGWCGAAVLLRRRYLDEVGHFDERLFMYAEDADLAWRGARRGWRYRYVPTSIVHHLHRASSGGQRTARLDVLNRRNRLVVVTRHGGLRVATGAWGRALAGIVVAIGTDVLGPLLHRRRPDLAPLRRRVRAAVDAARLLAGGDPPLP